MNNIEQETLNTNKKLLEAKGSSKTKKSFFKRVQNKLFKQDSPIDAFNVQDVDESNYQNLKPFDKDACNKKIAIYTCVTGGYDQIPEPVLNKKNIEYFAFTDSSAFSSQIWKKKDIPEHLLGKDNSYINRYIKLHPHEFFPDYDFVIYIDGNVKLISDITKDLELVNPNIGLATFRHCVRDCAYEEAKACLILNKGNKKQIKSQMRRFEKEGFPHHFGLFECTLLFAKICDESKQIFANWWNELISSQSGRDQLALPYVVWKMKLDPKNIAVIGTNVWLTNKFIISNHNK